MHRKRPSAVVPALWLLTAACHADPSRVADPVPTPPATTPAAPPTVPTPATPTPTAPPPPAPPNAAAITIQGNAYHPALLTVAPGATLSFTNADNRRHGASSASSAIVSTPIFTTGTQTVKMPTAAGTYPFQCAVHGAAMSGTIIVQ